MKRGNATPKVTIGLDLGDKQSVTCEVDRKGQVVRRATIGTVNEAVEAYFGGRERCRVVLEAGTHSPWVSRQLEALGHEVVVANPGRYVKARRKKRNDTTDAEFLARQGRADPALLWPIRHRGVQAQQDLAVIRARDMLVRARSGLINHVRGAVKSFGSRVPRASAESFPAHARAVMPAELELAGGLMLEQIEELTRRIRQLDRQIEKLAETRYPEAQHLRQPRGVGPITALAYVLMVEDPKRFRKSRDVGAYFGLVPRLDASSDSNPQLRITKAGDELGRRLLVNAASYILGPNGPDCDLRRFGEAIAARGGKNAKKRATVAVARKIAVLLHSMWLKESTYDPDRQLKRRAVAA